MLSLKLILAAAIFTLFLALPAFADLPAITPDNEVPLYEGVEKTPQELAADETFVKDALRAAGSTDKAANHLAQRGWEAIKARDIPTAIRRFNQAYLISKTNYQAYWGLGVASSIEGDFPRSLRLFDAAIKLNKQNPRLLCDYGFGIQSAAIASAQRDNVDPRPSLAKAGELYQQAQKLDPKAALPHTRLAVIYFYSNNCAGAKKELAEAKRLGGDGIDPQFVADLGQRCK